MYSSGIPSKKGGGRITGPARLLPRPAFALLVCCLVAFMFGWPQLSIGHAWSRRTTFIFLLSIWAAAILVNLLISRFSALESGSGESPD